MMKSVRAEQIESVSPFPFSRSHNPTEEELQESKYLLKIAEERIDHA